jgi:hypothetical protein
MFFQNFSNIFYRGYLWNNAFKGSYQQKLGLVKNKIAKTVLVIGLKTRE